MATIEIVSSDGNRKSCKAESVQGGLAIVKVSSTRESYNAGRYKIYHVASGLAVTWADNLRSAREAVEKLLAIPAPWESADLANCVSAVTRAAIVAVGREASRATIERNLKATA